MDARELIQLREEGFEVPAAARERVEALTAETISQADVNAVEAMLESLPVRAGFECEEPNELEAIRAARPERKRRKFETGLDNETMLNRFHGAWLGRSGGCALGKPAEGCIGRKSALIWRTAEIGR